MSRSHLMVMMEELQKENGKLKGDIIESKKKISQFEHLMINQLVKIGKAKAVYMSPIECLTAYTQQLEVSVLERDQQAKEIWGLKRQIEMAETKNQELFSIHAQKERRFSQQLQKYQEQLSGKQIQQKQYFDDIKTLNATYKKLKHDYDTIIEEAELKQLKNEEQIRAAIAAAVSSTKQEMVEYKEKLDEEFHKETEKLRNELSKRDQNFIKIINSFNDASKIHELSSSEILQMNLLIDKVLNFNQATKQINDLREENSDLKKVNSDILNRKLLFEVKVNELKTQMVNHQSKLKRKTIQFNDLQQDYKKISVELEKEKKGNQSLQHYLEEKWHQQFQRVKQKMQRHYQFKIQEFELQVQQRKKEISKRILKFQFLHQEDQKIIDELKLKIIQKDRIIQEKNQQIEQLEAIIQQLKFTIRETNEMMIEDQNTTLKETETKINKKDMKIEELKNKNVKLTLENQVFATQLNMAEQKIVAKLSEQQQYLQQIYKEKIIQLKLAQQQQLSKMEKLTEIKDEQHEEKEKMIVQRYETEIGLFQEKISKLLKQKDEERKQDEKYYKALLATSFKKQKNLQIEIEKLRTEFQQKEKEYLEAIKNKKQNLKYEHEKAQKDQMLKRQLRKFTDQKLNQIKDLQKKVIDLQQNVEAKQSQVNHLKHQLQQHVFRKEQWLYQTKLMQEQFQIDFQKLQKNHTRQLQILKSKIWQLEHYILNRPARPEQTQKIRQLNQKIRQLQSTIELKEAENIVLKQVKHHYEQNEIVKHQSEASLVSGEPLRRVQPSIKVAKRRKDARSSIYNMSDGDSSQVRKDVRRMKDYLSVRKRQTQMQRKKDLKKLTTDSIIMYNPKLLE